MREEEVNGDTTTDGEADKTSMSSKKIKSSWMRKTLDPQNQQMPGLAQRFQRVKVLFRV